MRERRRSGQFENVFDSTAQRRLDHSNSPRRPNRQAVMMPLDRVRQSWPQQSLIAAGIDRCDDEGDPPVLWDDGSSRC